MLLASLLISSFFLVHVARGNPLFANLTHHKREVHVHYDFSYVGTTGPLGWTGIDKAKLAICSTGKQQSPINIDSSKTFSGSRPQFSYFPTSRRPCLYNGHTFEVEMSNEQRNLTVKYEGKDYTLLQFHFHTPSEHFIDREYFPLEMHLVHKAESTFSPASSIPDSLILPKPYQTVIHWSSASYSGSQRPRVFLSLGMRFKPWVLLPMVRKE